MEQSSSGDNGFNVLLVEDEEIARTSLGRMLSMKFPQIRLHTAENGNAGLELYRRHLPQLVITDINMPQLNGIEMAAQIRAHDPQAQIIFLSAHSETGFLRDAGGIGEHHYVMKPVDRHELFALVCKCLPQPGL